MSIDLSESNILKAPVHVNIPIHSNTSAEIPGKTLEYVNLTNNFLILFSRTGLRRPLASSCS